MRHEVGTEVGPPIMVEGHFRKEVELVTNNGIEAKVARVDRK